MAGLTNVRASRVWNRVSRASLGLVVSRLYRFGLYPAHVCLITAPGSRTTCGSAEERMCVVCDGNGFL